MSPHEYEEKKELVEIRRLVRLSEKREDGTEYIITPVVEGVTFLKHRKDCKRCQEERKQSV